MKHLIKKKSLINKMNETQQNLFNQINAKFENKLIYVENISSGSSNFVIKVKKMMLFMHCEYRYPHKKKKINKI